MKFPLFSGRGLNYLHEHREPVIHGNLKPKYVFIIDYLIPRDYYVSVRTSGSVVQLGLDSYCYDLLIQSFSHLGLTL